MNVISKIEKNVSKNMLFLYFNRLLVQIAFGVITGFSILFFYEKFNGSIPLVLLLSGTMNFSYAILSHIGAKYIKKMGMRKMMIFALMSLVIMFVSRVFWDYSPMVVLAIYFISFSIYKAFYWIPYHIEFAVFTDRKSRGKQTAFLYNIGDMFAAVLPFVAGIIVGATGYNTVFIIGSIFVVLSILPLFKVNEVKETYTWSFGKLIYEVFDKENRGLVLSTFGNGLQVTVGTVIWPIFVFIITDNDYVKFGAILAVVSIAMIVLRAIIGKYLDEFGRRKVMIFSNVVYFTGWVLKAFVASITGIFIVDVYHRMGDMVNKLSFDVSAYDQAADNGHYIDEYTLLKEVAFLLGRTVMSLALIPVIIFWGIKVTFILGAFATLLMMGINEKVKVS